MVHMRQMAQLMHYYIVLQTGRQFSQPVVKAEVAQGRAGPPPRACVADKYFAKNKMVVMIKMVEPLMHNSARNWCQFFKLKLTFGGCAPRFAPINSPSTDDGKPRHTLVNRADQTLCKAQNRLQYRDKKRDDKRKYLQQKVEYQTQYTVYGVHVFSLA